MKTTAVGRTSRRTPLPSEHIHKRERLRKLVGTPEFPSLCPLWIAEIPDGYRFWYELYNLHLLTIETVHV